MTRLTAREVESILEPIFSSTLESLGLRTAMDSKDLERPDLLKILKKYNTRKIFRAVKNLIDRRRIRQKIMEEYENRFRVEEIDSSINVIVDQGLALRIETPEMELQLSPTYKLLITPLGVCFLYCYRNGLVDLTESLKKNISYAQQFLGSVYNEFMESEIQNSLHEREVALNKKEIAISLLLLLVQAISRKRALRISKSEREAALSELTKTINRICEKVFNESALFPDPQETHNAIRRTTGTRGLENKILDLYAKLSLEDEDVLYFKPRNDGDLLSIIGKVCEGLKKEEMKDNASYGENAVKLIDKHIKDRNFLLVPWIRRKFLDKEAETLYLQKLTGLFKRSLS